MVLNEFNLVSLVFYGIGTNGSPTEPRQTLSGLSSIAEQSPFGPPDNLRDGFCTKLISAPLPF